MIIELNTILMGIAALTPFFVAFFHGFKRRKTLKALGEIEHVISPGNKFSQRLAILLGVATLAYFLVTMSLAAMDKRVDIFGAVTSHVILLISLLYFLWDYKKIYCGELGFYGNETGLILWEKVERIEFDRDIGQFQFGVRVFYKGEKAPVKWYFHHKRMEKIKEILGKMKKI